MSKTTLDSIVEEVKKAESIVILTHESPDGDAVGSTLAMYNALKQLGKEPEVVIPKYNRIFKFLPGSEDILEEGKKQKYDLAISLDCGSMDRLNGWKNYFEDAKVSINIDHHTKNAMFGDYNYVDPASPACCQILIIVLEALNIKITKEIGTCLLTGIITDTGGFKYQGVTADTFQFVAWLLQSGINVSEIYKKAFQIRTKANFELSKRAIDRMEFLEDEKIAFTYITLQDEEEVNAEEGDHERIVDLGRDIEGVEVSIFLHQKDEKTYKVSLRSNDYVNVSDVATLFGGGGHIRAAGCRMSGTPEQIKTNLVNQIKKLLK